MKDNINLKRTNMSNLVLSDLLSNFKDKVNSNKRVSLILRKWSPYIRIQADDIDAKFTIVVENGKVDRIHESLESGDHEITIKGEMSTLKGIFSGKLNPVIASSEGKLKLFGTNKDEVKLDAICLVIWGI